MGNINPLYKYWEIEGELGWIHIMPEWIINSKYNPWVYPTAQIARAHHGQSKCDTIYFQCLVGRSTEISHLSSLHLCFCTDDLLGHSLHDGHHHGSSRRVAKPHRQEGGTAHEPQGQPETRGPSVWTVLSSFTSSAVLSCKGRCLRVENSFL